MCISSYDSYIDLMSVFYFFVFAISTRHTNYDAVGIRNMSLHPFLL